MVHGLTMHLLLHVSADGGDDSDIPQPLVHVQHIKASGGYCCAAWRWQDVQYIQASGGAFAALLRDESVGPGLMLTLVIIALMLR